MTRPSQGSPALAEAPARGRRQFSPAQVLVLGFAALIGSGTILLRMPVSAVREPLSLLDALLTATSAVCVTGLIVVDTPNDLTVFGQLVVLALIQLGGLGYMAITTVVAVALGRQLSLHERLTLQEALNVQTMEGLARFVLTVLKLTLAFELTGALILTARWAGEYGIGRAAYYGLFHAISAFNNAGFALFSDSLMRFRADWTVNLVVTLLVICGGLGFVVLTEIGRVRRYRRFSTHTRLVIALTGALIVATTALIWLIERNNPRTLQPLGLGETLLAAYFQAVTPRTAGFNTLDIGAMRPASLFLLILLMFIGAAPGGTAGGVKISTLSITVAVIWAMARGSAEPTLLRRRIPPALVARAFSISLIGFLALNIVAGLLLVTEGRELLPTLFETTSAFGTVGLSMGEAGAPVSLVAHFTGVGKVLVIAMMFMGRIGPLTLAVAIARRREVARVRHPEGKFLIG
ncbi:MAG TPA: TrkH family potassium uptake protein [Vicinamibacterales bacterium]|nr:TrkH family potassium uptake protein [Vicinamibacterales bacterium]